MLPIWDVLKGAVVNKNARNTCLNGVQCKCFELDIDHVKISVVRNASCENVKMKCSCVCSE